MKKIKYHTEIKLRPLLGKEINALYEKEGWELVSVIQNGDHFIYYFKKYE